MAATGQEYELLVGLGFSRWQENRLGLILQCVITYKPTLGQINDLTCGFCLDFLTYQLESEAYFLYLHFRDVVLSYLSLKKKFSDKKTLM